MTITQTIDIPADRRITVPREVPTGKVILTFTPAGSGKKPRMTEEEEIEWINKNAEWLNKEAMINLSFQVPLWEDEEK
ncbi:MAG: hypothetical protein LBG94_01760 [Treponema sp.]|jgi:hypothetical protein|nr:hypothetical protein [Treponema sp.]